MREEEKQMPEKREQERKEEEAREIEKRNKAIIANAIRIAKGYYITEEEVVKFKTVKKIGGEYRQVEDTKVVEVKKFIKASETETDHLLKVNVPEYDDTKKVEKEHKDWYVYCTDDVAWMHGG